MGWPSRCSRTSRRVDGPPPSDRVGALERRLAAAREGEGPVFEALRKQIDALSFVMERDRAVEEALGPRLAERRAQLAAWEDHIVEHLEAQLEAARSEAEDDR